jgi:hypothetical protein
MFFKKGNKMKSLKIIKKEKGLSKKILFDIFFYFYLSFGFLIASLVAIYFDLDHFKVAFVWSIILIPLLIKKTEVFK